MTPLHTLKGNSHRPLKWMVEWAMAAVSAIGCDGLLFESPTATTHRSVTTEFREDAPVEIHSRNGFVRISYDSARTAVEVEADIRCGGASAEQAEERADASRLVANYTDQGVLRIEPAFPTRIHDRDGASLQVQLPAGVAVLVRSSNGEIVAQGVQGSLIQSLDAETSNAPVHVVGVEEDATLSSQNGAIVASHIGGALRAETSNAPITITDVAGKLHADTSNGAITLELEDKQSGPIQAKTSNAPIQATVPAEFAGSIEMQTSNAKVAVRDPNQSVRKADLDKSAGTVVIGDGASTSRLATSNGSIVVQVD